ncbi:MAG: transglutaminase-like domain-containing protein [Candidatus Thiodiazotropha sp.]
MMSDLVRHTVRRVLSSQPLASDRERCIALHDFVRNEIRFGFTADFETVTPEQTLQSKKGHCNAQGDLFCALLGEAGISARLRFVQIEKQILRHAVPEPIYYILPPTLFHAVTQVNLSDRWFNTDSYLFDIDRFQRQKEKLIHSGLPCGFGLSGNATCYWDGSSDAFAQAYSGVLTPQDQIFPSLRTACDARAGNNTLFGIHFNTWLSWIPSPLRNVWEQYANSRL